MVRQFGLFFKAVRQGKCMRHTTCTISPYGGRIDDGKSSQSDALVSQQASRQIEKTTDRRSKRYKATDRSITQPQKDRQDIKHR